MFHWKCAHIFCCLIKIITILFNLLLVLILNTDAHDFFVFFNLRQNNNKKHTTTTTNKQTKNNTMKHCEQSKFGIEYFILYTNLTGLMAMIYTYTCSMHTHSHTETNTLKNVRHQHFKVGSPTCKESMLLLTHDDRWQEMHCVCTATTYNQLRRRCLCLLLNTTA